VTALSRRQFLATGGALLVTFKFGAGAIRAQMRPPGAPLPNPLNNHPGVDAWLHIGADDRVTVFTGKAELGQGLKTALVQLAAEELDIAPGRVTVVIADTGRTPNEMYTAGSRSIPDSGMAVRYAAAEARRILLEIASERLGVPVDALRVNDGRIQAGDRFVRFGELVGERMFDRPVDGTAPLKQPEDYRLVGQSLPRVDLPAKVFGGEPAFVQDLRLENMLHARMVHPPTQQSRLINVEISTVETLPGVRRVLRDGSLLAVIAAREEQAIAAAARLAQSARWSADNRSLPQEDTLEQYMRAAHSQHSLLEARGELSEGGRRMQASYLRPFQAHASMAPSCSVALMRDGLLTVWASTQGVFPLREEMSRVLELPLEAIRVIHMESSGCYGQNGADDVAMEAALLARALPGTPIRLQWSREDEFGWEPLGAAMLMDCEAALDDSDRISEWRSVVRGYANTHRPGFGPGPGANLMAAQLKENPLPTRQITNLGLARNAVPLYDFPVIRIEEEFLPESPVRLSSLRSLGAYANVFALESFMDEMALAAGADPVAFRLAHLSDTRGRAVIEAAADAAGWAQRDRLPAGRGLGIGYARYSNNSTYCAVVADVSVADTGAVRVQKMWAATDCGPIINPDGVRNQISGGAIQSASWTLKEAMQLHTPASRNWAGYPILRFDEAPDVEVVLIDRPDMPIVGAGEASQGPTAAAIANAVYAASGARVRQIPLTPERVRAAR
jgi:nicotinate dehydrogenase subunit B